MSEIHNVNGSGPVAPQPRIRLPERGGRARVSPGGEPVADRVEISVMGTFMGKLHSMSDLRRELVERVRAEIEAGRYETPQRLKATVDILLRELGY